MQLHMATRIGSEELSFDDIVAFTSARPALAGRPRWRRLYAFARANLSACHDSCLPHTLHPLAGKFSALGTKA
jgi:hypothetical protein